MQSCVLAIDGGGSKTVCALAALDGKIIGRGSGGVSNPNLVSASEIRESLQKAIQEAVHDHPEIQIEAVCAGVAGVGASKKKQEEVYNIIWQLLNAPPFCNVLDKRFDPTLNIEIVTDTVIALVAGSDKRHGIAAISGTGSVVYGETLKGQRIKVGGWGCLLDEGSGYAIGRMALKEILLAYDVFGKTTHLAQLVLNAWNLNSVQDIVNHIYQKTTKPADIANLAKDVNSAASTGDELARDILRKAANNLYCNISAVTGQMDFGKDSATLVLSGGVLMNVEMVRKIIIERVRAELPVITSIQLCREPVNGAVILALKNCSS